MQSKKHDNTWNITLKGVSLRNSSLRNAEEKTWDVP